MSQTQALLSLLQTLWAAVHWQYWWLSALWQEREPVQAQTGDEVSSPPSAPSL
jgi:hypothetical protein